MRNESLTARRCHYCSLMKMKRMAAPLLSGEQVYDLSLPSAHWVASAYPIPERTRWSKSLLCPKFVHKKKDHEVRNFCMEVIERVSNLVNEKQWCTGTYALPSVAPCSRIPSSCHTKWWCRQSRCSRWCSCRTLRIWGPSKRSTAAPLRASWLAASPLGMATAWHPTARRYRG